MLISDWSSDVCSSDLEMTRLIGLAREHDFVVLFDECYSEIYTGETPPPCGLEAAAALGGSLDNVVVFQSLSKRSSVPGLRSGFVTGDPAILAAVKRVREYGGAAPALALGAAARA